MLRKFYLFLLTQKPIPAMDATFGTQFDFLVNLVLLLKNISNLESTIIFLHFREKVLSSIFISILTTYMYRSDN